MTGTNGSVASGGAGGRAEQDTSGVAVVLLGGGGGAGYGGGGGGYLGGGGGSGYASAALTDVTTTTGANAGNGSILLSYTPPTATAPGAPTGVTVTPGNGQATVSWSAPADDGGAEITDYEVTAKPGGQTCDTSISLTCDVTGLDNGTEYGFTVVAYNSAGSSVASTPVTATPAAPVRQVSNAAELNQAFNPGPSTGCGATVRLTQSIANDGFFTHSCGADPITLDLNGHDLTVGFLSSSFSAATGSLVLTNSSDDSATLSSVLNLNAGDVRVLAGVTVAATSLASVNGTRSSAVIIGGTGRLVVDGGTVTATSTDPLVPAIGGRLNDQGFTLQGTGSVVVNSGSLTASGTGQDRTAPVIGGPSVTPLNPTRNLNGPIPVQVRGGTLTLDAGSADAPAYGAGANFSTPLSAVTTRLALDGSQGSPAKVVLTQGRIPSVLLGNGLNAVPAHNELANGGVLLPNQNGEVLIPEAIKVTGHHYRVGFPGDTELLVAGKTFATGGVTLPVGSYVVGSTSLTDATDLSTLGGTRDDTTGVVALTATEAPVVADNLAALNSLLNINQQGNACGRTVQLGASFPATTTQDRIRVSCPGSDTTLDLNGISLLLKDLQASPGEDHSVTLTSTGGPVLLETSSVLVQDGALEVRAGVTVRTSGYDDGDLYPGVHLEAGALVVNGGTVEAGTVSPLVPAVGGYRFACRRVLPCAGDTGTVTVLSGTLKATGAAPTAAVPVAASAIVGADPEALDPTAWTGAIPVTVKGGTLVLDSGDAGTPALGAGSSGASLLFGGRPGQPARVELEQGILPVASLSPASVPGVGLNTLVNGGAVTPEAGQDLVLPSWLTVTGHHYRVSFPSPGEQGLSRLVAAKTFAAGRVGLPDGSFTVNGTDLTDTTDLSTLGGTPDATGLQILSATVGPRIANNLTALGELLDSQAAGNGCDVGIRLGRDIGQPEDVLINNCGSPVVLDLAGHELALRDVSSTMGSTLTVRSSTPGGSMTVSTVDLSSGGTFVVGTGASLTASGRQALVFNEFGPTITYLYPGVQLGATSGTFRVDGGSATVRSSDAGGPAIGALVVVDNFAADATGSVQVRSGSLSVSKALGSAPLIGGDGFSRTGTIGLSLSGGSASLDAGGANGTVLDMSSMLGSATQPLLEVGGSAENPGSLTISSGRVVLADKTFTGVNATIGAQATMTLGATATLTQATGTNQLVNGSGEIVNGGTILVRPTQMLVAKVSGNNYLLTFPTPQGQEPVVRRVLAKTLADGGGTLPEGRWKIGSTKLTTTTDLSLLTAAGTTNRETGLTSYDVEVGSTEVGTAAELETALETCEGTSDSPESVVLTSSIIGGASAPAITVACVVELDLNGKDLDLASLVVDGWKVTLNDTAAVKGRVALDESLASSAESVQHALSLDEDSNLVLQGANVVLKSGSSMFAEGGGAVKLESSAVLDLQGQLLLPAPTTQTRLTLDNDGTVKVPLSSYFDTVRYLGNAFVLNLNLKANSSDEPIQAFALARKVSDLGSTIKLPIPTAAQTPEDTVFEGWFYLPEGGGDVEPVKVTESTDLRELLGAATGGAVFADLTAKFSALPEQEWEALTEPQLENPETGVELSAAITVPSVDDGGPDSVSWFWERSTNDEGYVAIEGASGSGTTATYTPELGDVGSGLRVVFIGLKDGFAKKRLDYAVSGQTEFGPLRTLEELEAALGTCGDRQTSFTLGASISAPTASVPVACEARLNVAGFDLTLAQIEVPDGTSVTITDSGRETSGGLSKGLLTLDGTQADPAGSPFAIAPDGDDDDTVAGSVTIRAAVAIGGAQVVPTGSTLEVGSLGVLSKVGGVDASISGGGLLANSGRIGSGIVIDDEMRIDGTFTFVRFVLPGGDEETRLVLGSSLGSVGLDFPVIGGLADDEYVRWGTAPQGGTRVLGTTSLGALEDDEESLTLYPTIVKKGTEVVSSIEELAAALAAAGEPGGASTIRLSGDLSAPTARLTLPAGSAPPGVPVTLDLNGFDLSVDSISVAPGALVVSDSTVVEPGDEPGVLSILPDGERPGVVLTQGSSFMVASGVVTVRAASGQPGIGVTGAASAGAVSVTGGVLEVVANLAATGGTAIGSIQGRDDVGSVSVTGGELRVRGFSTDHASLSISASGRVVALTTAEAGQSEVPVELVGAAIDGRSTVVNNGVVVGDLAGVKSPVAPNNAVVTFATAGGDLPTGTPSRVRAYAGTLGAAGLAALPTPTRGLPGQWVFAGWKVVGDGPATDFATTTPLPAADEAGTTPGAVTITAQWTPQSIAVTTATELQAALADGWPIVSVPTGTALDLGTTVLDLGSSRLVVPVGASVTGGTGAAIIGAAGAVIDNRGAISVPVPVGTGATAYAGSFRGDAFTVSYSGLTGDLSTAQVLGASVDAVGGSLPAGPVVPGKKFVGWSLTEQTGSDGANPSPEVLAATTRLGTATAVDGALQSVTLHPVHVDRAEITTVDSVEALLEALTCANGITAPVKVEITADLDLGDVGPIATTCAVELDLSDGSLIIREPLTLGGDLKVAGGELQLLADLALGVHQLSIGATGKVSGGLVSTLSRAVDGERGGSITNNGVFSWPLGLGSGDDAVPVRGLHYAVSLSVPSDVTAPDGRTVFASTVAGAGAGSALPVLTRPGFTFLGWGTKADGSGELVSSDSDLVELVGRSEDGDPVAVELFALFADIPVSVPSASPTATPTATPTSTPTSTATPTGGLTLPVGEPTLEVDPVDGGGSTGGTPQVGVPVTVTVQLPDVEGAAVAFQWQVVLEDGTVVDIDGATGDSFVPTGDLLGGLLQVRITTTAPGFSPSVQVVAFPRTQPVRPGAFESFEVDRSVRGGIEGHPRVGRTVTAVLPSGFGETLPEDAEVAYAWAAGRKVLAGGADGELVVRRSMLTRRLQLTVTLTAPGYEDLVVTSSRTRVVKPRRYTGPRMR